MSGPAPQNGEGGSKKAPTAALQQETAPDIPAAPSETQTSEGVDTAAPDQANRPKTEKAEPINIVVRDQSGAGLQFKVRKNTKFEKVMTAFCQKKHYQISQVRFLFEGERIREDQTPQSVDMEEGDIIDCVIEQLGAGAGPGLAFMPADYPMTNVPTGLTPENLLYNKHPPMMSVPLGAAHPSFCTPAPPLQNKVRSVPMSDSCVLKLKGLPYSTTEQEIYDFFSEYEIRKVAFVLESDGRPSGLAFAEFDSTEEALRAMQKNGEYIGDRYVKLLHVPKQEMEDQVKFGTAAIPKTPKPRSIMGLPTAALYGLPGFAAPQTYLPQMGITPQLNRSIAAAPTPGFHMAPGAMPWSMAPSTLPAMSLPANLSLRSQHPFVSNPFSHIRHFTNDGSTVRVRGLPFRVTEHEIREFFQSFNFIPTSVQIDKDTSGRSSGEGWITFVNPEEARRAVREKNRQYLQNRYLELSILQIT